MSLLFILIYLNLTIVQKRILVWHVSVRCLIFRHYKTPFEGEECIHIYNIGDTSFTVIDIYTQNLHDYRYDSLLWSTIYPCIVRTPWDYTHSTHQLSDISLLLRNSFRLSTLFILIIPDVLIKRFLKHFRFFYEIFVTQGSRTRNSVKTDIGGPVKFIPVRFHDTIWNTWCVS